MTKEHGQFDKRSVHHWMTRILQIVMAVGLAFSIYEGQWLNSLTIAGIIFLTCWPSILGRKLAVVIPPEFELATIGFIFAALFLGETRGYYGKFWWWDIALHTTSGGLLGVLGVLL